VTVVIMATVVILATGPLVADSKVFSGNVVADALLL